MGETSVLQPLPESSSGRGSDVQNGEKVTIVNKDMTSTRWEYYFEPPAAAKQWLLSQLKDERDAPMAYLIFDICITAVPAAVALFLAPRPSHWLGLLYVAMNTVLFLQRFILCLHYLEHLQPFREDTWAGRLLGQLCPSVLSCLYGIPPGVYRLHHVVMHHVENNIFPWDVSSTEPYQRDNFLHFLFYWVRFWAAIWIELPLYAFWRRRYGLLAQALGSLAAFATVAALLQRVSPVATLWVLVVPFFVSSLAMMFGNWSQHIFIDPAHSRSSYGLTYNIINSEENMKTFNDGYHIIHHVNSKLHWTQLPVRFMETLEKHAEEDALVFDGLSFFEIGFLVFTGQLDAVAHRYVNLRQKRRSRAEVTALLHERLRPISAASQGPVKDA